MAEITKLRHLTSAGIVDCKKLWPKPTATWTPLLKSFARKAKPSLQSVKTARLPKAACWPKRWRLRRYVALCCETDFVAKNAGFVALTTRLLDTAVANRIKSLEELNAFVLDGQTVAELVTEESGKTGEKIELGRYECLEAPSTTSYNHLGNKLSTIAGFNVADVDYQVGRDVAMQIASMNPVAVDRDSVDQAIVTSELNVAIEKTKEEQVKKAIDAALKKAGINPNLVDSEDHIESNIAKGWLTAEEADKARTIIAETGAAKAANLPQAMIDNIANGRLNKFFKENCLMEQEFVKDGELTIGQYLEKSAKGLAVVSFKRVNLNQD